MDFRDDPEDLDRLLIAVADFLQSGRGPEPARYDRELAESQAITRLATIPVLTALRIQGFDVDSVWGVTRLGKDEMRLALGILVKIWPEVENIYLKRHILDCFYKPHASPFLSWYIDEFQRLRDAEDVRVRGTFGSLIGHHSSYKYADVILELAADRHYGHDRLGIVRGLARLKKDPRIFDVITGQIEDELSAWACVTVLRDLGDPRGLPYIAPFLTAKWARDQKIARRAMNRIHEAEVRRKTGHAERED